MWHVKIEAWMLDQAEIKFSFENSAAIIGRTVIK